jgi:hypothetical protein
MSRRATSGLRIAATAASTLIAALLAASSATGAAPPGRAKSAAGCTGGPVDCVPGDYRTFDIPFAQLPGGRVNAKGELDKRSSPKDAHAGAFVAAKKLGLMRNFEWLHWIPTAESRQDPQTGEWGGGDLDGFPTGWGSTGLGIAGDCLYWGRSNSTNTTGPGATRDIIIFRIQKDPAKNPPVEVGRMPQLTVDGGRTAVRDRELRPYNYVSRDGRERMLMVRSAATGTGGDVITYTVDPATCLPVGEGAVARNVLAHEFYLWHDPKNPNRFLVLSQTYGAQSEDLVATAITDEDTGEVLKEPVTVAGFTLEEVGGPVRNERPDASGLVSSGRFSNYSHLTDQWGRPGAAQPSMVNNIHSGSLSDDGERFYAAGTTAGFYILNTEALARHSNAELVSGSVCNRRSTNVWIDGKVGGVIDVRKLPAVAKDCLHPVLNSDPGVLAMLASDRSDLDKLARYVRLESRSRFSYTPPLVSMTGVHSAVPVPGRPSQSRGNDKARPAWVVLTEEWPFGPCPERGLRIVNVEQEITPMLVGAIAQSDSVVEDCLAQPKVPGAMIRPMMHAHNPTVLPHVVFVGWLGHGLRAIDITNPFDPREVGHARTVPWGDVMSYPDIHDGLIYIGDNHTGLHVLRYTGPYADEVPKDAIYSSNRTSPHPSGPPKGTPRR